MEKFRTTIRNIIRELRLEPPPKRNPRICEPEVSNWEVDDHYLYYEYNPDDYLDQDRLLNYNELLHNHLELLKVQNALDTQLKVLRSKYQDTHEYFEFLVRQTPGLSKFSLAPRVEKEYNCNNFQGPSNNKRCPCDTCFRVLKENHIHAVCVKNIIRKEIELIKGEHKELLKDYDAFVPHLHDLAVL